MPQQGELQTARVFCRFFLKRFCMHQLHILDAALQASSEDVSLKCKAVLEATSTW